MASQKIFTSLLVMLLILPVIPQFVSIPANNLSIIQRTQTIQPLTNPQHSNPGGFFSTPGPDLGITNWTHNHVTNPGLETWSSPYIPRDWNYYRTPDRYQWFATDPPFNVSQGTYSGGQQTRSSSATTGWSNWAQYSINADMRNLTLTFDWCVTSMPNQNYDFFLLYFQLSDGRYLYYYLVGGDMFSNTNTTTSGFYRGSGVINAWVTFHRNLTSDYLAIPGFPASIAPGLEADIMYFYLQAAPTTTQWVQSFFDDVWLQNETTIFIGGSQRDGDLESGTFTDWIIAGRRAEGYLEQSSTSHTGLFSCNLTSVSDGNMSLSQLYQYPRIRLTNDNQGSFSLWWHFNQDQATSSSFTSISFYFRNITHYFYLYYLMGYGGTPFYSNTSTNHYYHIDGFNTTGIWQHFQCNPWMEASSLFNNKWVFLESITIHTNSGNTPGSRTELLIDEVKFTSRTVTVADFEDQGDSGTQVYGMNIQYSNNLLVTDQSYSGGKAANCSLLPYGNLNLEQNLHRRPLNSTRETYLDLMWRIEDFSFGHIFIILQFHDNRNLYYTIATSDWGVYTNSSNICYYNVTGSGTIGSWIQLHRDLVHDYEAAFGGPPNTEMQEWDFDIYTANANLEVLFDDIYIYDDPAPRLSNHQRNPSIPVHNDDVQVDIDAEDQDLDLVQLAYRVNGGTWNFLSMTPQTGNTYRATIPGQPFASSVDYYLIANDTWGMSTIHQDGPSYYSYTVTDLTPPDVSAISQLPSSPSYLDWVNVSADCVDTVPGMGPVDLYYRVDGGTWLPTTMNFISGNTYRGQIPDYPWNSVIDYYINATDSIGNIRIDDNGGSYYSYTVADPVDPELTITAPQDGQDVNTIVDLGVIATDPGSGIDRVEFFIDGTLLGIDTSAPYGYSWDSTTVTNGNHTITYTVYDNAGNSITDSITVTVLNVAPPPPIPGFPVEALILGITGALGIILVIRRRRKH